MDAIEQHPFKAEILEDYITTEMTESGLLTNLRKEETISLITCKKLIRQLEPNQRPPCLKGLSTFIASGIFHKEVIKLKVADEIRLNYDSLFPDHDHNHPVIVRSSGIAEDSLGAAHAGKYSSEVHGEVDIVRTCLKVMASGYQPQACFVDGPQPMALVIQEYIKCCFGGGAGQP